MFLMTMQFELFNAPSSFERLLEETYLFYLDTHNIGLEAIQVPKNEDKSSITSIEQFLKHRGITVKVMCHSKSKLYDRMVLLST